MASKKQSKTKQPTSKAEIERWERDHAHDPELRIVTPLAAVRLDEQRAATSEGPPSRREPPRTYLPKGFVDHGGYLHLGGPDWSAPASSDFDPRLPRKKPVPIPSQQQVDTARTVVLNLTRALEKGTVGTEPYASAAAAAYERLLGYAPGQYWRKVLVDFLKDDALHRESKRRYREPPPTDDPVQKSLNKLTRKLVDGPPNLDHWGLPIGGTDRQVLAWLGRQVGVVVPPQLTTAALKFMRERVSPFGGGGGRGPNKRYSAEQSVALFCAAMEAPPTKLTRRKTKKKRRAKRSK